MVENTKQNGDIVQFLRSKDYVMINNNLGCGSFGKTVLLKDTTIDELFVAKKYEPEYSELKEKFYNTFKQEIKIMYKLSHNNIVRIYNYYLYEEIKTGFIIMEYVSGKSIDDVFQIEPEDFTDVFYNIDAVFIQLIEAFEYLEKKKILHRDIRENNILIDEYGDVKVIDFGLGKMFKPVGNEEKDSKNDKNTQIGINRNGLNKLPDEYYDGTYAHKTDMFYLAELLDRLINKNDFASTFSYQSILDKMMESNPKKRYDSFAKIKEAIDKKDFNLLDITDEDKSVYQSLTNMMYQSLAGFIHEKKFEIQPKNVLRKLNTVLKDNCFENVIQQNNELIKVFVATSFKYNNGIDINTETVKEFALWFQSLSISSQQLVINNITKKLATIAIVESDPELPFQGVS